MYLRILVLCHLLGMHLKKLVRLTAVLLNSNGEELADTKTSDYIIYTNARIYQEMIAALQGAAVDNADSETKAG